MTRVSGATLCAAAIIAVSVAFISDTATAGDLLGLQFSPRRLEE
jgi:hypothetical protein